MADNSFPNYTEQKYVASMLLAAVGDALGYKNGDWEFCTSGSVMHAEAESYGGINAIKINKYDWMVSDDTVMHIATAKALLGWETTDKKDLYDLLCDEYVECWKDMDGRAAGVQCGEAMPYLEQGEWGLVPYSNRAGGCGATMRAMCIGLFYYKPEQLDDLIAVSVESGRMTHNHPTGFLGAVAAAVFTSYAVQGKPVDDWGRLLVTEVLPKTYAYLKASERDYEAYTRDEKVFKYFENNWQTYLALRGIAEPGHGPAKFPEQYGVKERDRYYKSISFSGMGGSSGHDSVIIAYDALLGSGDDWTEFLRRGALHGGDSDSTGSIGAAWWGVLYGLHNVPYNHYQNVEKRNIVERLGKQLFARNKLYIYRTTTMQNHENMIRRLREALPIWLLFIYCTSVAVTADFVISAPNIAADRLAFQGTGSVSLSEITLSLAQNNTASIAFWKDTQNVLDGFKAAVLYTSSACDTQGYSGGDGFTFFFTTSNSVTDYLTWGGTFGLFQKRSIAMVGLDLFQGRIVYKATNASTWLGSNFDSYSVAALRTWRCIPEPVYVQLEYTPPIFRISSNVSALDVSVTMDLNDYFAPSTQLYVGLSASTGNAYMKQSITYWEYSGTPPVDQVIPILECYEKRQNDYVAYMGFNNPTANQLTYEIGVENQFTPAPQNRNQPTIFPAGRSQFYPLNAYQFVWDGSEVTWTLSSNFVKFDGFNPAHLCPTTLNIVIVFGTTAQLSDAQVTAISQSIANFMGISAIRVTFQSISYVPVVAKRSYMQGASQGTLELEIGGTTEQTQNEPSAAEAVQKFVEGAANTTAVNEVLNPVGVQNVEFISTNPKSTGTEGTGTLVAPAPTAAQPTSTSNGISFANALNHFNLVAMIVMAILLNIR